MNRHFSLALLVTLAIVIIGDLRFGWTVTTQFVLVAGHSLFTAALFYIAKRANRRRPVV
jgi:hypothetical protein